MKLGYETNTPEEQFAGHPDAKKNLAGGLAFNIKDPSQKLLAFQMKPERMPAPVAPMGRMGQLSLPNPQFDRQG